MDGKEQDYVEVDFDEVIHETENAVLFEFDKDRGREVWVPRSALQSLDVRRNGSGSVEIVEWFAKEHGLI